MISKVKNIEGIMAMWIVGLHRVESAIIKFIRSKDAPVMAVCFGIAAWALFDIIGGMV